MERMPGYARSVQGAMEKMPRFRATKLPAKTPVKLKRREKIDCLNKLRNPSGGRIWEFPWAFIRIAIAYTEITTPRKGFAFRSIWPFIGLASSHVAESLKTFPFVIVNRS
ncbi:MAG: hypothetical protein QXO94_07115, partial [Candidatus Bathyarchaeia archaeon]